MPFNNTPMKKDHPIFVQYLFKCVWKSYNYCSFLDKNGHVDVCSILNVCDFHTIENLGYNNCSIIVQYMSNNIFIENLVYKNRAIIIQFENRLKFRIQKAFNFCIIYSY